MNPQPNRFQWQFVAIAAGVCLGLSVAAYALGVQPLLERRAADALKHTELQERRQNASQLSASLADVQHQLATAKQALAKTSLRLQPAVLVNHVMINKANVCQYYPDFKCTDKADFEYAFPQEAFSAYLTELRKEDFLKGFEDLVPAN